MLDDTEASAELGIIDTIRTEWLAKAGRLRAERDASQEIAFDQELIDRQPEPDIANLIDGQRQLFAAQRAALTGRQSQLEERIIQLKREISGLEAQLVAGRKQSDLINQELEATRGLLERRSCTEAPRSGAGARGGPP